MQIQLVGSHTFDIGKGAGEVTIAWSDFPESILIRLLEYGVKQKVADGHSDIKASDDGAAKAARDAAEDMIAALQSGVWSERGGRAANPVAKHARTIASLAAQAFFAGLTITKDATKVKPGSPADRARNAIAKAKGVAPEKVDMKVAWTNFVQTKMKDPDVLAQARQRAEEDKAAESADAMSAEDLKALGLV